MAKATEAMFSKFDLGTEYLRSSDLLIDGMFKSFTLTIKKFHPACSLTGSDGKSVKHPVLEFVEAKKMFVANATSQEILHMVTGQSDGFKTVGYKVTISVRVVQAFGDACLGLRLMPAAGTLLRRGVKKYLGEPAVFVGAEQPKEETPNDQTGTEQNNRGTENQTGSGN